MFSGGEPTLNGEMLEYIVDKIIEQNIKVGMFMLGINGLFYSEALVRGLNKLNDYIKKNSNKKCPGWLFVSQDQFHKEANPEVISKLSKLPFFSKVEKTITPKNRILPYGRAYKNKLSTQEPNIDKLIDFQKNYKITEYENKKYLVISYQYIAANGNVINDGCQSYEIMDEFSLGNVKEKSMIEIYLKDNLQKRKNKR